VKQIHKEKTEVEWETKEEERGRERDK